MSVSIATDVWPGENTESTAEPTIQSSLPLRSLASVVSSQSQVMLQVMLIYFEVCFLIWDAKQNMTGYHRNQGKVQFILWTFIYCVGHLFQIQVSSTDARGLCD